VTTVRHVARAVGSTGSNAPAYRVDVRVAATRGGTPITTTLQPRGAGAARL
jgi:hypothetical protein